MCNHDCLCFFCICRFEFCHINIVLRNRGIHKNRNRPVLDDRGNGCRKPAGNGYDFISSFNLSLPQLRGSQRHKRNQVCRRPAVYQMRIFDSNPVCKFFFKFFGKSSCSQPEIQGGIRQGAHFLFIKHASCIADTLPLPIGFFFLLKIMVILCHQFLNPASCLFLIFPFCHFKILHFL